MLRNKRLLLIPLVLVLATIAVLGLKIAYPYHRIVAISFLLLGWIPLLYSYQINRRLIRANRLVLRKKTRPYFPHIIVALLLILATYVSWVIVPIRENALAGLDNGQIREEIDFDLGSLTLLCKSADDFVTKLEKVEDLIKEVEKLDPTTKSQIRNLWREGFIAFHEFELLKEKYRGFYQIDYVAEPSLHADTFFMAYAAYVAQYNACLKVAQMIGNEPLTQTFLNERNEGLPANTLFKMKQRLTHPRVLLRMNAGNAYFALVEKDLSVDPSIINDFKNRKNSYYKSLGENADIFVSNPIEVLERTAFYAMFPIQKKVAVQMSHIRTTHRDYLITPEIIQTHSHKLKPGDILIQRRNWHMTNIGIPGFWPHTALHIGTTTELDDFFSELGISFSEIVKESYPDAYEALLKNDNHGFPMAVIEAIRPGVVFQSLEKSGNCDYLAVIRPLLSKQQLLDSILNAISHWGKPYDLNFDFTTDNELVCSELVYKAFQQSKKLPMKPTIINGRLLLPPNLLVEQAIPQIGPNKPYEFVFFLDAKEKTDSIEESDFEAFKASWNRPKWDFMQK